MSDVMLRRIIVVVLVALLIRQIGLWLSTIIGDAGILISVVVVGAVSYLSSRMARVGVGTIAWFLVPIFLFIVIPVIAEVYELARSEESWWKALLEHIPFWIGFLIPAVLLVIVYAELRRRAEKATLKGRADATETPSQPGGSHL